MKNRIILSESQLRNAIRKCIKEGNYIENLLGAVQSKRLHKGPSSPKPLVNYAYNPFTRKIEEMSETKAHLILNKIFRLSDEELDSIDLLRDGEYIYSYYTEWEAKLSYIKQMGAIKVLKGLFDKIPKPSYQWVRRDFRHNI